MADILVRGLDDNVTARLKEKAKQTERSLNDLVKEVLSEASGASRKDFVARIRTLRVSMGSMPDNSLDLIREDRNR